VQRGGFAGRGRRGSVVFVSFVNDVIDERNSTLLEQHPLHALSQSGRGVYFLCFFVVDVLRPFVLLPPVSLESLDEASWRARQGRRIDSRRFVVIIALDRRCGLPASRIEEAAEDRARGLQQPLVPLDVGFDLKLQVIREREGESVGIERVNEAKRKKKEKKNVGRGALAGALSKMLSRTCSKTSPLDPASSSDGGEARSVMRSCSRGWRRRNSERLKGW